MARIHLTKADSQQCRIVAAAVTVTSQSMSLSSSSSARSIWEVFDASMSAEWLLVLLVFVRNNMVWTGKTESFAPSLSNSVRRSVRWQMATDDALADQMVGRALALFSHLAGSRAHYPCSEFALSCTGLEFIWVHCKCSCVLPSKYLTSFFTSPQHLKSLQVLKILKMPSSPESPPPQVHRFPATSCLPPRRSPPNGTRRTRAPVKLVPEDTAAQHVLPLGPRTRLSPVASPEWLLAPTPDSPRSHADDAACSTWTTSWERARLALTAPRTVGKRGRMLSGMRKVGANGCGAWRKEENMCQWSGECNVEDMEELQVWLRTHDTRCGCLCLHD
ncbi:hypothetical protein K438DRAFT_1761499 [Mycena galopus ATCC 62051]|nr:hypothetical protein K438DRAFT_1761499 [Mycena galopus ATCC 62051]